ncbi:MAG: HAD-IIA family hydrolase [Armatimonadota bacterium]
MCVCSNIKRTIPTGIRCIALDLDGVVYQGRELLPGADAAIKRMRDMGLDIAFVTNSSGNTREAVAEKLSSMGVPAAPEEVITAAYATATLVKNLARTESPTVFPLGMDGLRTELLRIGAKVVENPPCQFLVVGLDKHINYHKICLALDALLDGAIFVACNRDARYPYQDGKLVPGCAAVVGAVEGAIGRGPDYYAGKPDTLMLNMLSKMHGLNPKEILMVGDSLESDIAMANAFGSPSAQILSPEGRIQLEISNAAALRPTIVLDSLAELPQNL